MVGWSLMSLFSTNMAISETIEVREEVPVWNPSLFSLPSFPALHSSPLLFPSPSFPGEYAY